VEMFKCGRKEVEQVNVKAEVIAKGCPFLNSNQFCVVTKAGAGCRREPYCASENYTQCGDYQKADNMDVQVRGHHDGNQGGSPGQGNDKEIIDGIISLLAREGVTVEESRELLMSALKKIFQENGKKKVAAKGCPYLNINQVCVATKVGAGWRLEPYCASDNYTQCGDYQKFNNHKVNS